MLHVIVQYGTEEHRLTENEKALLYRDLYRKILLSSVHKGNKEHEFCAQHPKTCSRLCAIREVLYRNNAYITIVIKKATCTKITIEVLVTFFFAQSVMPGMGYPINRHWRVLPRD
jgi:hypothetical protein